jgi:predicted XRE-type DNA-binding protein
MIEDEPFEYLVGSENIHADFGLVDAEVRHIRAQTAAEIIKTLDREKITVRAASEMTGVSAADISRIRNADLSRFTIDRLVRVLTRLNSNLTLVIGKRAA